MSHPLPDRAWIAARIPHRGTMCLLDGVTGFGPEHIECRALLPDAAAHPLAADGELGIANGIEYAAQAMAVHGAMLAATDVSPRAGYLTSVRDVQWTTDRLDAHGPELRIHAQRLSGDERTVLYAFQVHAGPHALISGRASVMLDAATA